MHPGPVLTQTRPFCTSSHNLSPTIPHFFIGSWPQILWPLSNLTKCLEVSDNILLRVAWKQEPGKNFIHSWSTFGGGIQWTYKGIAVVVESFYPVTACRTNITFCKARWGDLTEGRQASPVTFSYSLITSWRDKHINDRQMGGTVSRHQGGPKSLSDWQKSHLQVSGIERTFWAEWTDLRLGWGDLAEPSHGCVLNSGTKLTSMNSSQHRMRI